MRTTAIIQHPDSIEVTISMTMNLGQWKKLKEQLTLSHWPSLDLHSAISDVVRKVERQVQADSAVLVD